MATLSTSRDICPPTVNAGYFASLAAWPAGSATVISTSSTLSRRRASSGLFLSPERPFSQSD